MEDRSCPGCGEQFTPGSWNQKWCGRRCKKRAENEARRGPATFHVPDHYDCAHCEVRCVPGLNVPPHASRFCSATCKKAWHYIHVEAKRPPEQVEAERQSRRLEQWTARLLAGPTRRQVAAYRKTLRRDPCSYCGGETVALDHIEAKTLGGSDDWTNRTAACKRCNSTKGSLPLLVALPWIPIATRYHEMRRELFSATGHAP